MTVTAVSLAILATAAGVGLLHLAWSQRSGGWFAPAGWALISLAVWPWHASGAAWDKAIALAALVPSLAAIAILAAKAEFTVLRRTGRTANGEDAASPAPATGRIRWRGWVRAFLAGPAAAAAALGLASAIALRSPGIEADRFIAALFVMPAAWAAGAIWATTDAKLLRVSLALLALAAAGFGIARA